MKKVNLLLLACLCMSLSLFAQPPGYPGAGTQWCWKFGGRDHGYFRGVGNGERHILISFTGDGERTCGNMNNNAPQKWLSDAGYNWDGRTVRAEGDTIVWEIFTVLRTVEDSNKFNTAIYSSAIDTFFKYTQPIDTSKHCYFHIQGLSAGARNLWLYLFNSTSPYRKIFSTTITMSTPQIDTWMKSRITIASAGRRNWVWHGATDGGCCPKRHSDTLYKYLRGHKILTIQPDAGHTDETWDSALSLHYTDTVNSRWHWMVNNECTPGQPPADPSETGGPAGYMPGTQVCWTFNGRPHGYFRAGGKGEKHVLVSFATQNETGCDDYNENAPQKWLPANWDGRTVRAPGDTIRWEILTIVNTNNNSLPPYAEDINYFFANTAPPDTSNHNRFHAEAKGPGGVNRMWGYLVNAQNHNGAYRNIFGTTITLSSPHIGSSGLLSLIHNYSPGRRHWVWYGTADAGAPAAASNYIYDTLQGLKHLTAQAGGTAGAGTWDSTWSRSGNTTNTNRWLWMITPGAARQGIETAITTKRFSMFPNPARTQVRVNFEEPINTIVITDLMGRPLKQVNNIKQRTYMLDVSTLKQGVYFIQIDSGGKRIQQKLVKE